MKGPHGESQLGVVEHPLENGKSHRMKNGLKEKFFGGGSGEKGLPPFAPPNYSQVQETVTTEGKIRHQVKELFKRSPRWDRADLTFHAGLTIIGLDLREKHGRLLSSWVSRELPEPFTRIHGDLLRRRDAYMSLVVVENWWTNEHPGIRVYERVANQSSNPAWIVVIIGRNVIHASPGLNSLEKLRTKPGALVPASNDGVLRVPSYNAYIMCGKWVYKRIDSVDPGFFDDMVHSRGPGLMFDIAP